MSEPVWITIPSTSYLEYAFLRWVLGCAANSQIASRTVAQSKVTVGGNNYFADFEIKGSQQSFVIELDGFEFHSSRDAFSSDRLRQNDIHSTDRTVVRFSYDSIRLNTQRCVDQLQAVLGRDPELRSLLIPSAVAEAPQMDPDPAMAHQPSPVFIKVGKTKGEEMHSYFDKARNSLELKTLRECQREAYQELEKFYLSGGVRAACVMSVGAGKTALGVLACLALTKRRAMIVTPGSVIRGTFASALDHTAQRNVLYGLPGGPLIPGCPPPRVLVLDRDDGAIKDCTRESLMAADIIVTNFHSLGNGEDQEDLLAKLQPDDIDFLVVDEAHIAAAESYQRTFERFGGAKKLLMSACFSRLDGKPIEAEVVYRYRLIDSIADGNAKNLRLHRFEPDVEQTCYELVWPDGSREEIRGKEAILDLLKDEKKLANITARSTQPIRQIMREVKRALESQAQTLYPVKPRVLFSAIGEQHAEQISMIAQDCGIPCSHLHYSMGQSRIKSIRNRFETDSGDLQGIVQLKMLGQGYDFPPITVVVPMRPYGSFAEFYQFIGRGIRTIIHPALTGRVGPGQQNLDIVYHSELGLDQHIQTICLENDMDPNTLTNPREDTQTTEIGELPGTRGNETAEHPDAFVLFEQGAIQNRMVHDPERVERRREERELEALAQRYAQYAQSSSSPLTFEQYVEVVRSANR